MSLSQALNQFAQNLGRYLLVALSSFGWFTVAFYSLPALWSLLGIGGTLACLASLEIAGTFRLTLPALTVRSRS